MTVSPRTLARRPEAGYVAGPGPQPAPPLLVPGPPPGASEVTSSGSVISYSVIDVPSGQTVGDDTLVF